MLIRLDTLAARGYGAPSALLGVGGLYGLCIDAAAAELGAGAAKDGATYLPMPARPVCGPGGRGLL